MDRMEARDFMGLWMPDRHVMPLWRMACAAPGKDWDFSPFSLVENISRNRRFASDQSDKIREFTFEIPLRDIMADVIGSIRQARLIPRNVEPDCHGRLEVDDAGQPVVSRDFTSRGTWKAPRPGGRRLSPDQAATRSRMTEEVQPVPGSPLAPASQNHHGTTGRSFEAIWLAVDETRLRGRYLPFRRRTVQINDPFTTHIVSGKLQGRVRPWFIK